MKKEKVPFHGIIFFTGIVVCIIITTCNGQENNGYKQNAMKEEKPLSIDSNFEIDRSINQISGVIPAILEDSKGNIWFGTQNGVFKQTTDSLIHIDRIKDESGKGVTIEDIAEDKDGRIWRNFITNKTSLCLF